MPFGGIPCGCIPLSPSLLITSGQLFSHVGVFLLPLHPNVAPFQPSGPDRLPGIADEPRSRYFCLMSISPFLHRNALQRFVP